MLLPAAGAILFGLPSVLLAFWFAKLTRKRWLHGGAKSVAAIWLFVLVAISGVLTPLCVASVAHPVNGFFYNAWKTFVLLLFAGGIPSAVIAVITSSILHYMPTRQKLAIGAGAFAGIAIGIIHLRLVQALSEVLWN